MSLKEQTEQLKKHLDLLKGKFEENDPPEHISDKKFFLKMKEETAPIYQLLEEWEKEALEFIKNKHVRIYPHQINATKENVELILLHSYYVDIRKRIYMEYYKSSHYIFDQILSEIHSGEGRSYG